jgi:hypothetical protein
MSEQFPPEIAMRVAKLASKPVQDVAYWLNHSDRFREMCEDYERSLRMAARWRSYLSGHLAQINDYEQRSRELESKIDRFLQERGGTTRAL